MGLSDPSGVGSLVVAELDIDSKVSDTGYVLKRGDGYGGLYTTPEDLDVLARGGRVFVMTNATIGTGVAQTTNTTLDTTKPFIFGINPSTSKKSIHLVRLVLKAVNIQSGQTIQQIAVVVSQAPTRSSAGTDYLVAQGSGLAAAGYRNLRGDSNLASVMSALWVGAPVAVLGSSPRLIANYVPRIATIPVAGDEYVMHFGSKMLDASPLQTAVVASTTVNYYAKQFAPCVVGPGSGFMVIPYAASVGGAMTWEFELIWYEK